MITITTVGSIFSFSRAHDSAIRLFQACDRLARRAVVVADLRRGWLGPLTFWVGARALRFDPVTVAESIDSGEVTPLVQSLAGSIYDALVRLLRYL